MQWLEYNTSVFVLELQFITASHLLIAEWFNTVTVHNRERLLQAVEKRPVGTPLITASNHHSCLDDPIIWGE
jgi:monolysocardiolipin acyltransferase